MDWLNNEPIENKDDIIPFEEYDKYDESMGLFKVPWIHYCKALTLYSSKAMQLQHCIVVKC